ncbi:MAG: aminodeoxychorismate/anthranilate synthase component II [Planctomycetota bacterium]
MIQIIDNYDSFTYNLVQRLGEIDPQLDIRVDRNDEITVDEIIDRQPDRAIISPGPCTPNEAGISVECVERLAGKFPLLGVCLGHQSIGQAFGGKIVRADRLMHGKTDRIHHIGGPMFEGLNNPFQATRYHSLLIQPESLPDELEMTAWCEKPDGTQEIMAVAHREYPLFGLQFHPESFLTHAGTDILQNFLNVGAVA